MTSRESSIREIRRNLAAGKLQPVNLAEEALSRSNKNAGHNVYLWQNAAWTRAEAAREDDEALLELAARIGTARKMRVA